MHKKLIRNKNMHLNVINLKFIKSQKNKSYGVLKMLKIMLNFVRNVYVYVQTSKKCDIKRCLNHIL